MKKQLLFISLLLISTAMQAQEIGIQLYSVRNEVKKDLKGTLQKVRAMGIKELEGGELYGLKIQDYKSMLDQMGYKMVSIVERRPEQNHSRCKSFGRQLCSLLLDWPQRK
jgi:hypothetical protein